MLEKVDCQDLKVDDLILMIRSGSVVPVPCDDIKTRKRLMPNLWPFRVGIVQDPGFRHRTPEVIQVDKDGKKEVLQESEFTGCKTTLVWDKWLSDIQKRKEIPEAHEISCHFGFDWGDGTVTIYRFGKWARDEDSPDKLYESKGHIELML
jgi:hypothetical protein